MPAVRRTTAALTVALATAATAAACGGSGGSSTAPPPTQPGATTPPATHPPAHRVPHQTPVPVESNPPGDIPDNLAFVRYTNHAGGYTFVHPEGWAQSGSGRSVVFTDKLNGAAATAVPAAHAPTVASARRTEVPRLRRSVPAFQLEHISSVQLPGGPAVLIVFRRNSAPDPVTGQRYRDEVQEFLFWRNGTEVRLDLFGPVGADNVDAYRTMSTSLRVS